MNEYVICNSIPGNPRSSIFRVLTSEITVDIILVVISWSCMYVCNMCSLLIMTLMTTIVNITINYILEGDFFDVRFPKGNHFSCYQVVRTVSICVIHTLIYGLLKRVFNQDIS